MGTLLHPICIPEYDPGVAVLSLSYYLVYFSLYIIFGHFGILVFSELYFSRD